MFFHSLSLGEGDCYLSNYCFLNSIVNRVAFHGFEARFLDQVDEFGPSHPDFIVRFHRIALSQLAAFGNRAIDVISAEMQSDLRQPLTEQPPSR